MTSDDIVGILNGKLQKFGDEFKVRWLCGDLCLENEGVGLLARFDDFQPQTFCIGVALEDELEWEITDGSNKFETFMEVTKLFYAEAKLLLEVYWSE